MAPTDQDDSTAAEAAPRATRDQSHDVKPLSPKAWKRLANWMRKSGSPFDLTAVGWPSDEPIARDIYDIMTRVLIAAMSDPGWIRKQANAARRWFARDAYGRHAAVALQAGTADIAAEALDRVVTRWLEDCPTADAQRARTLALAADFIEHVRRSPLLRQHITLPQRNVSALGDLLDATRELLNDPQPRPSFSLGIDGNAERERRLETVERLIAQADEIYAALTGVNDAVAAVVSNAHARNRSPEPEDIVVKALAALGVDPKAAHNLYAARARRVSRK